ncbi:hypothetical protein [Sphingomonas alpina]|uniref:hypothetical protein n=1 Tax=Sphingomonas alpina TaxID=653931 RepID=UPI002DD943DD|nr:hypothetical protein [Sphingomonas alpina]
MIAPILSGRVSRSNDQPLFIDCSAPFRRTPGSELFMSIVIRTLSERVFEIVREQIVTGQLPEDVPIRQDALASDLGVSKIPLREARCAAGTGRSADQPGQSRLFRACHVDRRSR